MYILYIRIHPLVMFFLTFLPVVRDFLFVGRVLCSAADGILILARSEQAARVAFRTVPFCVAVRGQLEIC